MAGVKSGLARYGMIQGESGAVSLLLLLLGRAEVRYLGSPRFYGRWVYPAGPAYPADFALWVRQSTVAQSTYVDFLPIPE
jgi:hypothetical protein